jgi:hypothetical protein
MRTYISGGRGDGADWPTAGGILECGDDEAQHLVRAGLADPHEPEVPPDGADSPAQPPAASGADEETGAGPAVRAAKQDWVMHAVTLGADPVVASALTKADLIARYG